jgi:AcrR family transcriptional regulator
MTSTLPGESNRVLAKRVGKSARPDREAEEELEIITAAARRVLKRNGYEEANVTDILAEANLSTRAFYRHFASKDEVLTTIYRSDSAANARRIVANIEGIGRPLEALVTWVEEMLDICYDERKLSWAQILECTAARRAEGFEAEESRAIDDVVYPLAAVIRSGVEAGVFATRTPEEDARTIHHIVWGLVRDVLQGRVRMTYRQARAHVLRFCLMALTGSPPDDIRSYFPSRKPVAPRVGAVNATGLVAPGRKGGKVN